ncbi:hypothetical protein [Amycolatopsis pigmentata]|uniref:Flagellar basal body-associated protein FliL n=1 Tax=Amycolatopsis pigmentata TaxID=450801 RepID=A0ABW5FWB8_9PSEU
MSWQEELRKLDEELASGRLSADDYRVRRDQVLSSAVGQPDNTAAPQQPVPPAENNGAAGDSTQVIQPVSPPQGTPQQQPPPEDAERTQAVPPWRPQQPMDPGRPPYGQPQYPASPPGGFPQAGPVAPAGGFPQAGPVSPAGGFQQPWNAPEADQTPPWGGGDLPPLVPSGDPGWVQQGPESFDDKSGNGNTKKIIAIVAAVVVLAGIALGAYLLWGTGGGGGHEAAPSSAAQPTSQAPPDPLAVANIPGAAESHENVTTFNAVPGLNYLNSNELSTYSSAGAAATKYVVHHLDDGNTVVLLLTEVNSPVAAQNAANQLMSIQIRNGASRLNDSPNGVYATTIKPKENNDAQVRGHYAHGNVIVRVEVSGKNQQSAQTDFSNVLASQMQVLPANA